MRNTQKFTRHGECEIHKKVGTSVDLYLEQLVAGHTPRRKLLKHVRSDERILNIVHRFHETEPVEYLRGLAHNYDMYS